MCSKYVYGMTVYGNMAMKQKQTHAYITKANTDSVTKQGLFVNTLHTSSHQFYGTLRGRRIANKIIIIFDINAET